jgi:ATP-dependent Lhr-like helicase
MTADALDGFTPATRAWFEAAFAEPTLAQAGAWQAIGKGEDTLVVAPTGSGKTLAAFLWAIDKLAALPPPADPKRRTRVLYVSPLKALAVDIERNLRAPLTGIRQAAQRLGLSEPDIQVAVRTGDTAAEERRKLVSKPPDILITTPESLFLLLTSQARETLRGVETVIVDEVHAVAGNKRGAHLALSLERLDALRSQPGQATAGDRIRAAQRIGLSATVRPAEEVATFLGGTRTVTIVQPPSPKRIELQVVVPVEDMTELDTPPGRGGEADGEDPAPRRSIWPHVEERVLDLIEQHKSTIVFANSRRLAERLCGRLNELAAERAEAAEEARASARAAAAGRRGGRAPAELMAQAGVAAGAPAEVARAHHGSVSRQERVEIEEALKAGRLPAVVATSSLELGIDMGAVDLVIQVEAPPSVASGLQRVGRAGHNVGDVSRGIIFPKYQGDLVQAAVVAERMRAGEIEELKIPHNPLDVLAQQIVAMTAVDDWVVDELEQTVRKAAPFGRLTRGILEAVLDMLAGRYPSEEFAGLRPRIVWDRVAGTIRARPGAQRLAVTNGGTIPDRGLFGVFLATDGGGSAGPGRQPRRVGELDEEMVYESRVGDVFVLGASSWRIEDITPDRVLVTPAPGQAGKLPFWHGDTAGRPAELGRAIGAACRELAAASEPDATRKLRQAGLDELAARNLIRYLAEQRAATGYVPDDRTLVLERFRDELGDWRVVLHSPYGDRVHAPWALAIAARLRERYGGMDVQALHTDDGIIIRVPDSDEPPPSGIALLDPDEISDLITAEVGASALFASRFRECASRALLLPRRQPGRRTPLWQQRQRSAQLLEVASRYPAFPIVLETVRECLRDVFDVPALTALLRDIAARRIRLVEVETATPSPFGKSLLFRYVGAFMYEGDAPLAERRAQALSLDPSLLAELLGQDGLRELLDPAVIAEAERDLQHLSASRRCRDVEGVADLLRTAGPLTAGEVSQRCVDPGAAGDWLAELSVARRSIGVRIAGQPMWAAIEDAGRLRDALGVPLPVGIPEAFTEPVADPLGDLVARYARTHGPFTADAVAARYGLGVAVVMLALRRLTASGRVVEGEFLPAGQAAGGGQLTSAGGTEWCDAEVLRLLRRRCLARLRKEAEPVPPEVLARFLPAWHGIGTHGTGGVTAGPRRRADAATVLEVLERLAGAPVPASALETLILPGRVPDYSPALLDELTSAGEIVWSGAGALPGGDGWLVLAPADGAPLLLPEPGEVSMTPVHSAVLEVLGGGGAMFFRMLSDRVAGLLARELPAGEQPHPALPDDSEVAAAIWDLVWAGLLTNDTLTPLRLVLGGQQRRAAAPPRPVPRPRPGRRYSFGRPAMPTRTGPPTVSGRWSLLPGRGVLLPGQGALAAASPGEGDQTVRAHALALTLLERHGVLTRGAVAAERITGGFAAVYPVLRAMEEAGQCRRGYFVEGLGGAQFALPGAVDRMRALDPGTVRGDGSPRDRRVPGGPSPASALVLAAADPAQPYGAALPWPDRPGETPASHRPGRKAGALTVLVDGSLILYVERGGRTLLSWTDEAEVLAPAAAALAAAVRAGALGRLTVERADGERAGGDSPLTQALEAAGFRPSPRGLRLRAG